MRAPKAAVDAFTAVAVDLVNAVDRGGENETDKAVAAGYRIGCLDFLCVLCGIEAGKDDYKAIAKKLGIDDIELSDTAASLEH
jgi:hypothetical protein